MNYKQPICIFFWIITSVSQSMLMCLCHHLFVVYVGIHDEIVQQTVIFVIVQTYVAVPVETITKNEISYIKLI